MRPRRESTHHVVALGHGWGRFQDPTDSYAAS